MTSASTEPSAQPSTQRSLAPSLGLVALVFVTFWTVTSHGMLGWDDVRQILENPDFEPVTPGGLWWNFSHTRMTLYMPVTYLVWGAVAWLTGEGRAEINPFYFHLLNVALHAGTTLVVYHILRRLTGKNARGAFVGAAVFGVHPVIVEPVAWASAMYTLLSGLLSCLAIYFHLRAFDEQTRKRRLNYTLATAFYVIALLSKASSVVVPFMLVVLHVVLLKKPIKAVLKSLWPWFVLVLPTLLVARHFEPALHVADVPTWTRPLVAIDALAFYFYKVAWPVDLMTDYGRSPRHVVETGLIYRTWPVLLVVVTLVWISRHRRARTSLLLFVVALLPFVGLARSNFQTYSTVADRYLYLAMLGVVLGIATATNSALASARLKKWVAPASLLLIALLACRSYVQTRVWRDDYTLFAHNLRLNPDSLISKRSVAANFDHRPGKPFLTPDDAQLQLEVGDGYVKEGAIERAITHYEFATRADPGSSEARKKLADARSLLTSPAATRP